MTLLTRYLDLYVKQCQIPEWKANVWMLAQANAEQYPELLGDLPRLLTASMLTLRDSKSCAATTSNHTSRKKSEPSRLQSKPCGG